MELEFGFGRGKERHNLVFVEMTRLWTSSRETSIEGLRNVDERLTLSVTEEIKLNRKF